jgi:hypothetical protein
LKDKTSPFFLGAFFGVGGDLGPAARGEGQDAFIIEEDGERSAGTDSEFIANKDAVSGFNATFVNANRLDSAGSGTDRLGCEGCHWERSDRKQQNQNWYPEVSVGMLLSDPCHENLRSIII